MIVLFLMAMIISTFINNTGEVLSVVSNSLLMLAFWMVTCVFIQHDTVVFLSAIELMYGVLITLQVVIQIVNPSLFGLTGAKNNVNLLCSDNEMIFYYIPYLAVSAVLGLIKYNKITKTTWFMTILCCTSAIQVWAASAIIGMIFWLILLFMKNKKISRKLTFVTVGIAFIAIWVAVVAFQITEQMSDLFTGTLNKSGTLTGRTYIWRSTIMNIASSPWIGHGSNAAGKLSINYSMLYQKSYFSHNLILEVILEGGVLAFVPFLLLFMNAGKALIKYKRHSVSLILVLSLFLYLVISITESWLYSPFQYVLVIICSNVDKMIKCYEQRNILRPTYQF